MLLIAPNDNRNCLLVVLFCFMVFQFRFQMHFPSSLRFHSACEDVQSMRVFAFGICNSNLHWHVATELKNERKKNDSVDGLLQRWNECSMWTCSSDFESKAGSGKRRRMKPFVQFNSMHFCVAFYFVFILIYYFEIFPIDGEIYIYLLHMYERRLHAYSFVWSHGGEAVENECFMNLIDLKIQYNK